MPFQHKHHMILCYHETDSGDYIQAKIKTYISFLFLTLSFFLFFSPLSYLLALPPTLSILPPSHRGERVPFLCWFHTHCREETGWGLGAEVMTWVATLLFFYGSQSWERLPRPPWTEWLWISSSCVQAKSPGGPPNLSISISLNDTFKKYLFIFGCIGSSLLCMGFL